MLRERRALLGARIPTTIASCRSNWGVDAKACHLRDPVHYLQINLGEGRGLLLVPVDSLLNKACTSIIYLCSFVLFKSGYSEATDPFLKYFGTFRHRDSS